MISATTNNRGNAAKRAGGEPASHSSSPPAVGRSASIILHAVTQDAEIDFRVTLSQIYRETDSYLSRLGRAASEGRALDEANNFLRWLQFSGVLRLLELYSVIDQKFLTLRNRCNDLQEICRPILQGQALKRPPSQARVDELNAKMDVLLSMVAKSTNSPVPETLQITEIKS